MTTMTHELREVAAGLGALEGPVWTRHGYLLVGSQSRGVLYQIGDGRVGEGEPQLFAETGGGPNGLAEGPDGSIWVVQNGGHPMASRSSRKVAPGVQRVRNGQVEDLLTSGFDAPNDCVFAPDGRLWFTDPRGEMPDAAQPGRVCALDPTTLKVEVLADGPLYPNGLSFGLDPDDFYLAETTTGRILRARRTSDGIGQFDVFADLPEGTPDGIAFDRRGNLLVAGTEVNAVFVFDPGGALVETIEVAQGDPVLVSNLCFGGDDGCTLFITVFKGGRVFACPWAH
jgi:gluconolactonase